MDQQDGGGGSSGLRGGTGVAGTGLAAPSVSALSPSPSSIFSAVSPFVCVRAPLAHANKALPTAWLKN